MYAAYGYVKNTFIFRPFWCWHFKRILFLGYRNKASITKAELLTYIIFIFVLKVLIENRIRGFDIIVMIKLNACTLLCILKL